MNVTVIVRGDGKAVAVCPKAQDVANFLNTSLGTVYSLIWDGHTSDVTSKHPYPYRVLPYDKYMTREEEPFSDLIDEGLTALTKEDAKELYIKALAGKHGVTAEELREQEERKHFFQMVNETNADHDNPSIYSQSSWGVRVQMEWSSKVFRSAELAADYLKVPVGEIQARLSCRPNHRIQTKMGDAKIYYCYLPERRVK